MITEIAKYWDKQSSIWSEEKQEAWTLPETQYWLEYFKTLLPSLPSNNVLEVGTASGYFANILSLAGYNVTAIDLSPNMIEEAKRVSSSLGVSIDYRVMNAEEIDFRTNQFDLVFTRLMTWILPNVKQFYSNSYKVLKSGGRLINFDGDFGKIKFSQEGHENYPLEIMQQANILKDKLDISKHNRPEKDIELLKEIGFTDIHVDYDRQNKILKQEDSDSLFEITALKF